MNQRQKVILGAAGALLAVCSLLLVVGYIPLPKASGDAKGCTSQVHFYANDAPAGSHQFGPALVDGSLKAGDARLEKKLKSDPSFAAVVEDVVLYNLGKVQAHGVGWYTLRAQEFVNNNELWCKQVAAINNAISSTGTADRSETYYTFLMVPNGSSLPLVGRTERPVAMGHVLVLHLKDGRTEYLRYVCDLQPARPLLPGVPPLQGGYTPPSNTPGTPTTIAKCAGKKGAQYGEPCGTPNSGPEQQPVQQNANGVNTAPTPGYPGGPAPTSPTNHSPTAPPPNSGGYKGDGAGGKTPGGETCTGSSCTSGPTKTTDPPVVVDSGGHSGAPSGF